MSSVLSESPMDLVLFAALPQEMAIFKALTRPWRRVTAAPAPAWEQSRSNRNLLLMETGMGERRLEPLFQWATHTRRCDLVVSFGFGGGITPDLRVGDLCLSDRFVRWNAERQSFELPGLRTDVRNWAEALGNRVPLHTCLDVTTPRMASKRTLEATLRQCELAHGSEALVDMESYNLAELARAAAIPFLAVRSISDPLEHELDFDLAAITNAQGDPVIPRLLAALLCKPALILSFARLWRDSRKAGRALGHAVAHLMDIPRDRLDAILKTSIVETR